MNAVHTRTFSGVLLAAVLTLPSLVQAQSRPHLTVGDTRVTTNAAPVLDLNGVASGIDFSTDFQGGSGPVAIVSTTGLTVSDDAHHLVSARIGILNNLDGAAETLAVNTAGTNITATLGPPGASRVLNLSGFATKAEYQQVLRTATYHNTNNPVSGSTRTIQFRVSDGSLTSALATTTLTVDSGQAGPNFVVNILNDSDDDFCGINHCSLREAIGAANAQSGANTVTFKPGLTGTITVATGLAVTDSVSIVGPGARVLAVSGGATSRIFNFSAGTNAVSELALRDGRVASSFGTSASGGAILNSATLTLTNCTLAGNQARDSGPLLVGGSAGPAHGGAIYNTGVLTLTRCTLSGNEALGGRGDDAVFSDTGGNGGSASGGAVFNSASGSLTVQNCTFAGNAATGGRGGNGEFGGDGGSGTGGAVFNQGTMAMTAVSVSANTATGGFGGSGSSLANIGARGTGSAGGVASAGTGTIRNSIIAANTQIGEVGGMDVAGAFTSGGFNLLGTSDHSTGFTAATDQTGTDAVPLDARLGALQNNGGPTDTMALLADSPALDKGSRFALSTDQRLQVRPMDDAAIANATGGDGSDIGAFEVAPAATFHLSGTAYSVTEGSAIAIITVRRSGDTTSTATVRIATGGGTAVAGSDYTSVNNVITFAPGFTSQNVSIPILNDMVCEPIETLNVALGSPTGGPTLAPPAAATLTIYDEDCSFTISGRVANHSGAGMAGISITRGGVTVSTNSTGNFSFTGVRQGNYTIAPVITPSLNGVTFTPLSSNVTVNTSNLSNINFLATFTVTGRVTNHSGIGIANVLVQRIQGGSVVSTVTNASGNYSFTGVRSGSYTVQPMLTPALSGMSFFPTASSITVGTTNLTNINFLGSFSVSGRIANHSGVGIANVQVQRVSGGSTVSVFTNSSGNYTFANVRSGGYTIRPVLTPSLSGMTFSPVSHSVTVGAVSLTNQNFIGTFSVSGRVTTSANVGIANVLVRLSTGGSSTTVLTDSAGNYAFTNVRSGNYTITPTQSGKTFNPVSRSVTVGTLSLSNQNFIGSG